MPGLEIRFATEDDVPLILSFIEELADYERLSHEVVATEETLRDNLFGERHVAEVLLGHVEDTPVAFAFFFHNFSTFLGRSGIYLEDLFVRPEYRGSGHGKVMLCHLARLARERGRGRLEWWVLDWNESAIRFYKSLGAVPIDEWTVYRVTEDEFDNLAFEG